MENKEWIFSGIGVFVITLLFVVIKKILKKKKTKSLKLKNTKPSIRNINQYGSKSVYIEKNDGNISIN